MSELDLRYDELQAMLEGIRTKVDDLEGMKNPKTKDEEIEKLGPQLDRAKRDLRMVEMECRMLDQSARAQWKTKLKAEQSKLKQIIRDVEWSKTTDNNLEMVSVRLDPDKMDENNMIGYGKKVMNETNATADNTLAILEDTKATAAETAAKLKMQTEQLSRIHDQAFEIEDTLERATFIVKRMLRRTATDRYIWCLTVLILLAVIFIIVYQIVKDPDQRQKAATDADRLLS